MDSPIFHFRNDGRLIGTFVSKKIGDKIYFGWSRFNKIKERNYGNTSTKKIGIEVANKHITRNSVINTEDSTISKGTVTVRDPKMVKAAVVFINRLQRYYHKIPSNVNIIYKIEDLKGMIHDLIEENKTLRDRINRMGKMNMKLVNDHEKIRKENVDLVNESSELHELLRSLGVALVRKTRSTCR